jgi:hypothetical protein
LQANGSGHGTLILTRTCPGIRRRVRTLSRRTYAGQQPQRRRHRGLILTRASPGIRRRVRTLSRRTHAGQQPQRRRHRGLILTRASPGIRRGVRTRTGCRRDLSGLIGTGRCRSGRRRSGRRRSRRRRSRRRRSRSGCGARWGVITALLKATGHRNTGRWDGSDDTAPDRNHDEHQRHHTPEPNALGHRRFAMVKVPQHSPASDCRRSPKYIHSAVAVPHRGPAIPAPAENSFSVQPSNTASAQSAWTPTLPVSDHQLSTLRGGGLHRDCIADNSFQHVTRFESRWAPCRAHLFAGDQPPGRLDAAGRRHRVHPKLRPTPGPLDQKCCCHDRTI